MSVSTVRPGLAAERLERPERPERPRLAPPPGGSAAGDAPGGRGRDEAVEWVRRQLAWEHRLAGLREQAMSADVAG